MNHYWLFSIQSYLNLFFLKKLYLISKIWVKFFSLKTNFFTYVHKVKIKTYRNFIFKTSKTFFYKKIRLSRTKFVRKTIKYLRNSLLFIIFVNSDLFWLISPIILIKIFLKKQKFTLLAVYKKTIGEGAIYLRGLFIIFFVDACITDDEPLWEPLEWSLIQTWIFFIFIFAWVAENLITSRYGSYTGRDKRVWFAWYKTFWLIEGWYLITYLSASCFVIVPFYYEITYNTSFIFSWWNWYTKIFFYKFISLYTLILLISQLFILNIRWLNWKKIFLIILTINITLTYLLYAHFILSFFAYFTDPLWYQKIRLIDYIQNSHEPLKWGWGPSKRDHFSYHKTSSVFWFKNDTPFAGSFLMIHLFFFLTLFFLYLYWLIMLRKIYVTTEVSFTFSSYCVSALKQFFFLFLMLYLLIFLSFIIAYWRFPIEFGWITNTSTWFYNFAMICKDLLTWNF